MSGITDDPLFLANSVRLLIDQVDDDGRWLNIDELIAHGLALIGMVNKRYPDDCISSFLPPFRETPIHPHVHNDSDKIEALKTQLQLSFAMRQLLVYLETKVGDPVAQELLSSSIDQALMEYQKGNIVCAALLARVSLEQTLRRLCSLSNVDFEPKEKVSTLNEKLSKNGVYPKTVAKYVTANYGLLSEVGHGHEIPNEEINASIGWVDKFIARYLSSASMSAQNEAQR